MSKRILVVVSDPYIQLVIKKSLESFGYSAETVDNGRDALLQLERTTYSGLLLDPILPVLNGLEVLQQARKIYPTLPIVMMTGYPKKEMLVQAITEGAKEVLVYPIGKEQLRQTSERWFGATE